MNAHSDPAGLETCLKRLEQDPHSLRILYGGVRTVTAEACGRSVWMRGDKVTDAHLLYFLVEGAHILRVDGQRHELGPFSLVWLQPGAVRELSFDSPRGKMTQMYLKFDFGAGDKATRFNPSTVLLPHEPGLETVFRHVVEWSNALHKRTDYLSAFRLRARFGLLLCEIIQRSGGAEARPHRRRLSERQQQQILRSVEARPSSRPSPSELARLAGLSAEYFNELFRETFGLSVRRWLVEQRVRSSARCLLESTLSISETAERYGYPDIYLFSRQFKQVMGESPTAYRRNFG
jgi:AraC family transcriptional regulator of arabinose operon